MISFKYSVLWRNYSLVKRFFKNSWKFRKELSNFYDFNYDLGLFRKTIELNRNYIRDYGIEVDEGRLKKVAKMERALYILDYFISDDFLELAEKELDKKYVISEFWFEPCGDDSGSSYLRDNLTEEESIQNREIRAKESEIKDKMWRELWKIIQGQDYKKFNRDKDFYKQFNGSGILTWWD
jgi:hypothetical protein